MAEEKKLYIEGRLRRPTGQDHFVADIVDIEGFNGTSDAVKTAIFEALKNKLQGANGINIDANDSNKTITISCETSTSGTATLSWLGMSIQPTEIVSGSTGLLTKGSVIVNYPDGSTSNVTTSSVFTPSAGSIRGNIIYAPEVNATSTVTISTSYVHTEPYGRLTSSDTINYNVIPKPQITHIEFKQSLHGIEVAANNIEHSESAVTGLSTAMVKAVYNNGSSKNISNDPNLTLTGVNNLIKNIKLERIPDTLEGTTKDWLKFTPKEILYRYGSGTGITSLTEQLKATYTDVENNNQIFTTTTDINIYPLHEIQVNYSYCKFNGALSKNKNAGDGNNTGLYSYTTSDGTIFDDVTQQGSAKTRILYGQKVRLEFEYPNSMIQQDNAYTYITSSNIIEGLDHPTKYIMRTGLSAFNTDTIYYINAYTIAPTGTPTTPYINISCNYSEEPVEPDTPTYYWYVGKDESLLGKDGTSYDLNLNNLESYKVNSINDIYTNSQSVEDIENNIYVVCPTEWVGQFKLTDLDNNEIPQTDKTSQIISEVTGYSILRSNGKGMDSIIKVVRN